MFECNLKTKLFLKFLTSKRHYIDYSTSVRVRFAPSPTGFLHLGGLRTALYNYLFARSCNGKMLLRIEDTDQTRFVPKAVEQLEQDLQWCGIEIDEGPSANGKFGPYIQSERLDIYKKHAKILLENGSAYHCFCTERRLNLLRKEALRARHVPKYDNRCRHLKQEEVQNQLNKGANSCIRFKLTSGIESFNDIIFGNIKYDILSNEGDPIIMKTDRFPTYHFANVVDDHLMEISHVLRGIEWQISTTKHLLLYRAFNWQPPLFGHLPLLLNPDGTKLSKRQGDIQVSHYRNSEIFPLALLNFITHSGGGFSKVIERHSKPKCWTISELTKQFDISRINLHSGKLMPERLLEFNRLELKRQLKSQKHKSELVQKVCELVKSQFPKDDVELNFNHIEHILYWSVNRITKLSDLLSDDFKFIWIMPKDKINENDSTYIKILIEEFYKMQEIKKDDVNLFLKLFAETHHIKFGNLMRTLRAILSGFKEGPGVAEIVEILGRENTIHRLENSIKTKVKQK